VTYRYGFSAEVGGGEYGRDESFASFKNPKIEAVGPDAHPTISAAVDALGRAFAADSTLDGGVVELRRPIDIRDSGYYHVIVPVTVPAGRSIEIRAGDKYRPVVLIDGEWQLGGGAEAELSLNGLVLAGGALRIRAGDAGPAVVRLRHCTLVPGPTPAIDGVPARSDGPSLLVEAENVVVEIDRCIAGPLHVVDTARMRITNSLIDAGGSMRTAYRGLELVQSPPLDGGSPTAGGALHVENSTIIGRVHAAQMPLVSNTIFYADADAAGVPPVETDRLQDGCVRYSYVPTGSRVPHCHRCQPDDPARSDAVRPVFTSRRYGDATYGQLSAHCSPAIRTGADDGAEMGVFHDIYQPQREANLRVALEEYLRFGLEAGILYAS
jgi:hypothetical protein